MPAGARAGSRGVVFFLSFVVVMGLVIILSVASGMVRHDWRLSPRIVVIGPGRAS